MSWLQKHMQKDGILILGLLLLFALMYILTLPHQWLISDVYSYYNRAFAMTEGAGKLLFSDPIDGEISDLSGTVYALGNSSWLAIWLTILGKKYIYLSSLFCTIAGVALTYSAIKKAGYNTLAIFWLATLLPLQFYTRTLMSCMPSFVIVSLFLYLIVVLKENGRKWFVLCAIAVFSFWVRETNVLLLGSICLIHFLQTRKYFMYFALGSLAGLLPRLISHHLVYDNAFHYLISEPMSFDALIRQVQLYLFLGLALFPGALLFAGMYRGVYRWPMIVSVCAIVILYTAYDYDATLYSGFLRGSLVNSRFLLPATPLVAFMLSELLSRFKWRRYWFYVGLVVTLTISLTAQIVIWKEQVKHSRVSKQIQDQYADNFVLYDRSGYTNVLRYINPLATSIPLQADISKLADQEYMQKLLDKNFEVVAIISSNMAGEEKRLRTSEIESYLKDSKSYVSSTLEVTIPIENDLALQVFRLRRK